MKTKKIILLSFVFFLSSFCLLHAAVQENNSPCEIILAIDNSRALRTLNKDVLDYFIQTLNETNSLEIIALEKDARVIFPLQSLIRKEDRKTAQASLRNLNFKNKYTDINRGLKLAVSQLSDSKKNQAKIILLFDGGKIYPSWGRVDKNKFIKELRENILSVARSEGITIYTFSFGSANLELMQEIAHKTNGKSFVVYNNQFLNDILLTIKEEIESVLIAPASAQVIVKESLGVVSPELNRLLYLIGILLLILILLTFFLTLNNSRKLNSIFKPTSFPNKKSKDAASVAKLRASIEQFSRIFNETTLNFRDIQLDIEDFYARSWEKEKELKTKYLRLLDNLFLLLDYLEDALKADKKQEQIEWFYKRFLRILDEENIRVISIKTGERFDGAFHKHADSRPSQLPKGAILEIVKNGYLLIGKTEKENVVLRPVEVIVSSGAS